MAEWKDTNPKDAVGTKKVGWTSIPFTVLWELGLALLEGARKYARHNYRVAPVRASVYIDAAQARHLAVWWEGEDTDPDSGLSHITKAIASLVVLRDAMIQGTWIDDRPPKSPEGYMAEMNKKAKEIVERVRPDDPEEPYTELNKEEPR